MQFGQFNGLIEDKLKKIVVLANGKKLANLLEKMFVKTGC